MATQYLLLHSWTGWAAGDYGLRLPQLAAVNQFAGKNMCVTSSGGLMPRGGLLPLDPHLNAPTADTHQIWAIGVIRGVSGGNTDAVWFLQLNVGGIGSRTEVHRFAIRNPATAPGVLTGQTVDVYTGDPITTYPGTTFFATCEDTDSFTYLVIKGDSVYRLDHDNRTVSNYTTAHSAPAGANAVAIGGGANDPYLVLGGVDGVGNRVRWSAPANYQSWPSVNFVNVGRPSESIRALQVIGTTLYVLMVQGTLYAITGTLGVNETVRQVNVYGEDVAGVAYQRGTAVTRNNVLWHTRAGQPMLARNAFQVSQVPVGISGGRRIEHPELDLWLFGSSGSDFSSPVTTMRLDGLDDVVFANVNRMWAFINGAWARHEFPTLSTHTIFCHYLFGMIVCYDSDVGQFYVVNVNPDAPDGVNGDGYQPYVDKATQVDPGVTVDSTMGTSSAEILRIGRGMNPYSGADVVPYRVQVIVTRGPRAEGWNGFDVFLDCYQQRGSTGPVSVEPPSQVKVEVSDVSVQQMFELHFAETRCHSFTVRVENLNGCRVDEIRAYGSIVESGR